MGAVSLVMVFLNDIHFMLAFLVALCALVFSWNAMGRRVMNVVLGLQFLVGIASMATHLAAHDHVSNVTYLHGAGALLALALYGFAGRVGRRPGGARGALVLSILGLLVVAGTIYTGLLMYVMG